MNILTIGSLNSKESLIAANIVASLLIGRGWNIRIESTADDIDQLNDQVQSGEVQIVVIIDSKNPATKSMSVVGTYSRSQAEDPSEGEIDIFCTKDLRPSIKTELIQLFT